jgi:hypothetical protein
MICIFQQQIYILGPLQFVNVAVVPGLRFRTTRPLPGVDSANNVAGTKDIGIFFGPRRTAHHLSTYMERLLRKRKSKKTISISMHIHIHISFRRVWNEWESQAAPDSLGFSARHGPRAICGTLFWSESRIPLFLHCQQQ